MQPDPIRHSFSTEPKYSIVLRLHIHGDLSCRCFNQGLYFDFFCNRNPSFSVMCRQPGVQQTILHKELPPCHYLFSVSEASVSWAVREKGSVSATLHRSARMTDQIL